MEEVASKCNRCGGNMIYEKIYCKTQHSWGWRCVYCGEYIDRVILENRSLVEMGKFARTRNRSK